MLSITENNAYACATQAAWHSLQHMRGLTLCTKIHTGVGLVGGVTRPLEEGIADAVRLAGALDGWLGIWYRALLLRHPLTRHNMVELDHEDRSAPILTHPCMGARHGPQCLSEGT